MDNLKLNNSDNVELPIAFGINQNNEVLTVKLDKNLTPIAFENKVQELLEQKLFDNREEAEKAVSNMLFHLEIYYSKHSGLFAVEQEAVEAGTIYNPYSSELLDSADEEY